MTDSKTSPIENYPALLEHSYAVECAFNIDSGHVLSRLEYLSEQIFNFTTYDSAMAELFGQKAIEVCKAILDGHTFKYIEAHERHIWYLTMVNMPFFAGRLDWGTSIRGAWWSHGPVTFSSCGLWIGEEQLSDVLNFSADEWKRFVASLIGFANGAGEREE